MAPPTQESDRIVIGVDFGTTFSGVAEVYSGTQILADDIKVINTWPFGNNGTSDKVPSEIAYTDTAGNDVFDTSTLKSSLFGDVAASDSQSTIRWGFQLRPEEQRLRCVKLFLDPGQKLPSFVSESEVKGLLSKSGKDAVTVVADYLGKIYEHTREELDTRYSSLFMRTTPIQWILTVPAIWSDAAKDATLIAAKKAGMGPDITLISEPEAAAVYTLQAIQPNNLEVGDNFVVCDAGGGTVDLISYEIKQIRPLRIEESVEGSGGCCGAAMLNAGFEAMVREKLGAIAFAQVCHAKPKTWSIASKYFEEYVKRNYDPLQPDEFNVPFPGVADDEEAGIEQGFLTLSADEVGEIFRPIIKEVIDLVEDQISSIISKSKSVAGMVLVGGFGQSNCLLKSLKHVGKKAGRPRQARFDVMRPPNAWTAVVRGAVLRGAEGVDLVLSRKSRRHYGVVITTPFDEDIHPESCRIWDRVQGTWRADNRMRWYIHKGQTISSDKPILFKFHWSFETTVNSSCTATLIVCNSKEAPAAFDERPTSATKVLCKLVSNIESVPSHLYNKRRSPDRSLYFTLDCEIGMQLESGGLKFDMRVDGVVYGTVSASFESF